MTAGMVSRRLSRTEHIKVRRISNGRYRVCDMSGQGSQYLRPSDIPAKVLKTVDAHGIAYASGILRDDGRWRIGTAIACAETVKANRGKQ